MSRHLRPAGRGRAAIRFASALLIVGSTSLSFVPTAQAESQLTLTPTVEAWYQPNPSCATPAGCLDPTALPANSPYPSGTLHVGLSARQETARSYLALPLSAAVGTITAGSLSVPLDVLQNDGSSNPSTAKVQVCLTSATFQAVEGSFDTPPKIDCSTGVPAAYVEKPLPHLQADLSPLVSKLSSVTGLVLVPDLTKAALSDSWRIVLSSHLRSDAAKTPPATATISIADPPAESPDRQPVVSLPDNDTSSLGGITPAAGTGLAAAPPTVDIPTVEAPAATAPVVTAPVSIGKTITVGYAYPIVWLLPLAFLLLVPLVARALTRDLMPPAA